MRTLECECFGEYTASNGSYVEVDQWTQVRAGSGQPYKDSDDVALSDLRERELRTVRLKNAIESELEKADAVPRRRTGRARSATMASKKHSERASPHRSYHARSPTSFTRSLPHRPASSRVLCSRTTLAMRAPADARERARREFFADLKRVGKYLAEGANA